MLFDASQALVPLASQQALRLTGAQGTRLRAASGQLWVTVDDDPRDQVLLPGQSLVIDSPQRVIVSALGGQATVAVCAPRQPAARWTEALRHAAAQARAWPRATLPQAAAA